MTREEARQMIESMGKYLSEGNPIWETEPVKEATRMAIEALKEQEISNELQEYAYECGYEHFFHECQNCEYRKIGNKADGR